MSTSETLAWEDRARRWAVPAAVVGGLLPLVGGIVGALGSGRSAQNTLSLLVSYDRNPTALIVGSVLQGLGGLGIAGALVYLFYATRARRPETPSIARPLALAGSALYAITTVGSQVVFMAEAHKFVSQGGQTYDEARNVAKASSVLVAGSAGLLARALLAAAIVIVALNAMRTGLLTRFMGYIGIFAGALFILPIGGSPVAILQPFWLFALAVLFARRWPNGQPPAWSSGQAEPWPTQQELREQRAAGGGAGGAAVEPVAATQPAAGPADPGAARRKRKKRK